MTRPMKSLRFLAQAFLLLGVKADQVIEIQNSTIQSWLDLTIHKDNLSLSDRIQPCQVPGIYAPTRQGNCRYVCINETLLQFGVVNFNNCGLWAQLSTINRATNPSTDAPSSAAPPIPRNVQQGLSAFADLGLNSIDATFSSDVKDALSAVLLELVPDNEFSSETGYQCTQNALFGRSSGSTPTFPSALSRCIDTICYVRRLHPEISGVGVFSAMVMQIFLVLLASSFLIVSREPRVQNRFKGIKDQREKVLTALTKLHQDQCFFFTFVMIAEILALRLVIENKVSSDIQQRVEAIPLLLSVSLPIVFTHLVIATSVEMSSHVVVITAAPVLGAVATMVVAVKKGAITDSDGLADVSEFLVGLCGSKAAQINVNKPPWALSAVIITFLILTFCTICLITSTIDHYAGAHIRLKLNKRLRSISAKLKLPFVWLILSVFVLCFAYQMYIYEKIRARNLVSTDWTLGQVISCGAWVPAILEFFYLEVQGITKASRDRYPIGWEVNRIVEQLADWPLGVVGAISKSANVRHSSEVSEQNRGAKLLLSAEPRVQEAKRRDRRDVNVQS